jgi:hypothetical protein
MNAHCSEHDHVAQRRCASCKQAAFVQDNTKLRTRLCQRNACLLQTALHANITWSLNYIVTLALQTSLLHKKHTYVWAITSSIAQQQQLLRSHKRSLYKSLHSRLAVLAAADPLHTRSFIAMTLSVLCILQYIYIHVITKLTSPSAACRRA